MSISKSMEPVFSSAPGETVLVPAAVKSFSLYCTVEEAASENSVFAVEDGETKEVFRFTAGKTPLITSRKGLSMITLKAAIPKPSKQAKLDYTMSKDGARENLGSISIRIEEDISGVSCPFDTEIELSEMELEKSIRPPWLELDDWEGWLWIRSRYMKFWNISFSIH